MKIHLLHLAIIAFLFACNSNPTQQQANTSQNAQNTSTLNVSPIDQPIKDVTPAKQLFVFDNQKGMVKKTERHSIISVPENAFTFEDGTLINGELTIEFQEIFNPAEIILSGIPMNVKNNGEVMPFISDGMFNIQASCQGKKAILKEGKTIAVSTDSEKKNKDFDYWYFNEGKGEWENIGDRNAVLSEEQVMQKSEEINPVQTANYKRTVIDNNEPVNVAMKSNAQAIKTDKTSKKPQAPSAHNPNDFVFNISASYTDYPELSNYKNVLWKPLIKLDQKEQQELQNGMQAFGANVNLICKDNDLQIYNITYGQKNIEAMPVFIGSDRKKAVASYNAKLASYTKKLQEEADAERIAKRAAEQYAKTYNMFAVTQMGIYNCDRFYSYQGQKNSYTFKAGDKAVETHIFAILNNDQGVIALSEAYKIDGFYKLPTNEITGFIHTDVLGVTSYSKHDPSKAVNMNDIELSIYQNPIDKAEDLQKLIKSL